MYKTVSSLKISVFITSYNQKEYLVEAIDSVLAQTLTPFEIIIVDDCSSDGSQDVIETYRRQYPDLIRPFYHAKNLGIPKNKSFALAQVRGDLVTYLDGDDRFLPEKLAQELETYQAHPDTPIVYSNIYHITEAGERLWLWHQGEAALPTGQVFIQVFARQFPKNALFRNELVGYACLKAVGFYDPAFAMYHDWELRLRLTKRYKVAYCPLPLAEYRVHAGGISRSKAVRHLDEFIRIYQKHRDALSDLPAAERQYVEQRLKIRYLAHYSWLAVWDSLEQGNYRQAGIYLQQALTYGPISINWPLLIRTFMSDRLYRGLRNVYRSLKS
jgi:glycosyltransferase involved in cell wall biosynthesis